MIARLCARSEWKFFGVLPRADRTLAVAWWAVLVPRGMLPALFAIAIGTVVGAVQRSGDLVPPLALVAVGFLLSRVRPPVHQAIGALLGGRTAAWLSDRLTATCVGPPGMGHLDDPTLTSDLTMARDFDLGITGPPMFVSMDFIASGLVGVVAGLAPAVVLAGYAWWAPLLLAGAWLATHWLLRASSVWRDRNTEEVRRAQRHAAYRMAPESPRLPAWGETATVVVEIRYASS
jgi:ATP-binding cassette subfamily B protein